jgi:hypothetical protein
MAALLQLGPVQGTSNAADARQRLHQVVTTTLSQTAQRRLALVCHRTVHTAARPSRHRCAALPGIPIPPH